MAKGALLRNAGWLWAAEAVGLATVLVQGILVARWLGPRSYGAAALAIAYPTLIFSLVEANSYQATIKYLEEFRERGEDAGALATARLGYAMDATLSIVAFLLVAATAVWAEIHVVKTPGAAKMTIAYSGALFLRSPAGTSNALLSIFGKFQTLALAKAGNMIFRSSLILALVGAGWGIEGFVLGSAVGLVAEGFMLMILAYPPAVRSWGRASFLRSWEALHGRRREIARFLLWTDLGSTLTLVTKQADLAILGFFRVPTEAGHYRLAKSIAATGGSLVGPLNSVVYPRLAKIWARRDRAELRRTARRYSLGIGLPLCLAALATIPLAPSAIELLAGRSFLPAAPATQLLIASSAIWMLLFWLNPLFSALGRVRFWTVNSGVVAFLALVGFLLLGAEYGAVGIAWTQLTVTLGGHAAAAAYLFAKTEIASSHGRAPDLL